jgi:hypothetical protein
MAPEESDSFATAEMQGEASAAHAVIFREVRSPVIAEQN